MCCLENTVKENLSFPMSDSERRYWEMVSRSLLDRREATNAQEISAEDERGRPRKRKEITAAEELAEEQEGAQGAKKQRLESEPGTPTGSEHFAE